MNDPDQFKQIREFYDRDYYDAAEISSAHNTWHDRVIANRLGNMQDKRVLDVACGLGRWLALLKQGGAKISGIDLSERAITVCRQLFPEGDFRQGPAEALPFPDASFDLVTCMGSLEHFLDKPGALREMVRVAAPGARFLILVPNAGFLTRRLGLYGGTKQAQVREDVYTLTQWNCLLCDAGLTVEQRWRDLHPLDWGWIGKGRPWLWPIRALQAAMLPMWPVAWQYQVHHYCSRASMTLPERQLPSRTPRND